MISLIIATLDRVTELERLLTSLDRQSHKQFEVIVIDQNSDDRLLPVLQGHEALKIQHLRCSPGGSRARNAGLRVAGGDIIAFPDDDCWYPDELLATVVAWFDSNPDFGGLLVTLRDSDGTTVGPRWPDRPRNCTKEDIFTYAILPNGFLRGQVVRAIGFFNESIGIGASTKYQAGEDFDYFLRPLELGMKIGHAPSITVHHPTFHSVERLLKKSYSYSLGGAYVMRLHHFSPIYFAGRVTRSIGGVVVHLCKGDLPVAYSYLLRTAGQLRGYFFGARDLEKQAFATTAEGSPRGEG